MTKRRSKKNKNEPLLIGAIVILLLALAVGVYFATRTSTGRRPSPPSPPSPTPPSPPTPPPSPPTPPSKQCSSVDCKSGTSRGMDSVTCTTTTECQSKCCQAWTAYLESELLKLGAAGKAVEKFLKKECSNLTTDPSNTVPKILKAVKTAALSIKASPNNTITIIEGLVTTITGICGGTKPPSPPAADISQGGMLGGIVRDSRCASGYAVSGTNNPNTGRPYCTQ